MAQSLFLGSEPWATLPPVSGIYKIQHRASGKVYVGSSRNVRTRVRYHCNQLASGRHGNLHLLAAWRLYGPAAFDCSIVAAVPVKDLLATEQFYIDGYEASNRERGYNILPNARSPIGRTYTPEQRAVISERAKTRPPVTAETRARLSAVRLGVNRGEAFGRKMSEIQRGRVMSLEQRAKISATVTKRWAASRSAGAAA